MFKTRARILASLLLCAFQLVADNQTNTVSSSCDDLNRLIKVQYQNRPTIQHILNPAVNITSIQETTLILYSDVNHDAGENITYAVFVLKYITNPTLSFNCRLSINGDEITNITNAA